MYHDKNIRTLGAIEEPFAIMRVLKGVSSPCNCYFPIPSSVSCYIGSSEGSSSSSHCE